MITSAAEGDHRRVALADLPIGSLSPGSYELHAKVLVDGRPIGSVRRQITLGSGPMAMR